MTQAGDRFTLVRPDPGIVLRGLRCLMGGPEALPPARGEPAGAPRTPAVEMQIQQFLAYAQTASFDLTRQVLAVADGRVLGSCLWIASPGRTAMLYVPNVAEFPAAAEPSGQCITAVLQDAAAARIVLAQTLLEPTDTAGQALYAATGLTELSVLSYLERRPPRLAPGVQLPLGFRLEPYGPSTHAWFREAILASYEQTLDCPALSGLRDVEDVIHGHKAVGTFEPGLWSVVLEETTSRPVGCLLLANVPARRALELVYLGLAPAARGKGLGRALMQRTLGIAARRSFALTSLAVDAKNTPALRLYRRFGYAAVAQRLAMIRTLEAGGANGAGGDGPTDPSRH